MCKKMDESGDMKISMEIRVNGGIVREEGLPNQWIRWLCYLQYKIKSTITFYVLYNFQ